MPVTGASSRAIDSAAPPLHSAAPVAARGSGRSSVSSGSVARSRKVDRHFDEHPFVDQATHLPGKQIAYPQYARRSPTSIHRRTGVGVAASSVSRLGQPRRMGLESSRSDPARWEVPPWTTRSNALMT
jgi:hypothetical protein